jgi:hypothetical protein
MYLTTTFFTTNYHTKNTTFFATPFKNARRSTKKLHQSQKFKFLKIKKLKE